MEYRKKIESTEELARWYDSKYLEMNDGWNTPADEINQHLDDLGVPFDKSKWLLDVGAGAGHFLAEAMKRVSCVGLEISIEGIRAAAKRDVTINLQSIEYYPRLSPYFDYIVSMGSLEHIVDLDRALDKIRDVLKPDGKFYFFAPNEKWTHFDQPNERTMTDHEWMDLFCKHGLYVESCKRWNDSTAFIGDKNPEGLSKFHSLPPQGNKLCVGSGQKPYDSASGWINLDINNRWKPDVVGDWNDLSMFPDNSMDYIVAEHSIEHVGLGEADGFFREAYRVLKPEGILIITLPDIRALCQRWLTRQISDYIFFVNIYGAYMDNESDRHKFGYSYESICSTIANGGNWSRVGRFTWIDIPGSKLVLDWWMLAVSATK